MLVRAVQVPMRRPLSTSAQVIREAPLLLVDLQTDLGIDGHAYLFCYHALGQRMMADVLREASDAVVGSAVDPGALRVNLRKRWRLFGSAGPVDMALSGIDVALWDALSQEAGQPLAQFLGATPVPLQCYNSNGLGLIGSAAAATEALELVDEGYDAIKIRVGYPSLAEDVSVVRAVRHAVGDAVRLLVDYNQALDREEAMRRCIALDDEGVHWIEEPIVHDDYAGAADISARIATPLQLGENLAGKHAVEAALEARASDLLMFDLQRIGGVTGWLDAAAVASDHRLPLSSHLFPEVSAHLLALSPTRDWLEMVDWAAPILRDPLLVRDGKVASSERPGTGIRWDRDAVRRFMC